MVANASTNEITSAAVRQLSYMPIALLKIVYIKPPGIGSGRDTIAIGTNFDTISLISDGDSDVHDHLTP